MKRNLLNRKSSIKYVLGGPITVRFEESDGIFFEKDYDNKIEAINDKVKWEEGLYNIAETTLEKESYDIDKAATEGYHDAKISGKYPDAVLCWIADSEILISAYKIGARRYFGEN